MVIPVIWSAERYAHKAHAVSLGTAYESSAGCHRIAGFYAYAALVLAQKAVVIIVCHTLNDGAVC